MKKKKIYNLIVKNSTGDGGQQGKGRCINLGSPCRTLLSWNTTESKICYHDQGTYSWIICVWIYRSSLAQTLPLPGLKLCTENITHIELSTLNPKGTVTVVTSCTPAKGMRLLYTPSFTSSPVGVVSTDSPHQLHSSKRKPLSPKAFPKCTDW